MKVVHAAADLGPFAGGVFVPTMGALHAGHGALVTQAAQIARRDGGTVIVSVFVNPTQFAPTEDLARYPRTLEADVALAEKCGAHVVFAPGVHEMYPRGVDEVDPRPLPPVATEPGLEDRLRPTHFRGVCQVVRRLFEMVRARAAVFGEKDWQQLQVIRAMVEMEHIPIAIHAGETVREPDGLAMSSRNRFLTPEERVRALALSRALSRARAETDTRAAERVMTEELANAGIVPDYAVVRDAQRLVPSTGRPQRALIAGRLGSVRLIDNGPWG